VYLVHRVIGHTVVGTALRAFAWVFAFEIPFGGFVEDKGLSIALMLLLGLLAATLRETVVGPGTAVARRPVPDVRAHRRERSVLVMRTVDDNLA
jgi:hypothetical protein